jgi:NADH-quinone oxidoreductase subunit L
VFGHWVDHSLAVGLRLVSTRFEGEELEHMEHILLVPGLLAFLIGSGVAYWMYWMRKGEPAATLAEKSGGLYRLVLDKWRIDELYEATVLGFFHTLAEGAASFDQLIVDGVIAKLPSAVAQGAGAVLRLLQNGKVQTYSAVMTVGIAAIGYFFAVPHVDPRTELTEDGTGYIVKANPGLGYRYRWDKDGDGKWDYDGKWTLLTKAQIPLDPGKSTKLRLQVRSPFLITTERTIELKRPLRDMSGLPTRHASNEGGSKAEVH